MVRNMHITAGLTARQALTGVFLLIASALLACTGGCRQCPTKVLPVEQIVADHNANASAVPQLFARAKIALTLSNSKGQSFSWGSTSAMAAPNGKLLLFKPQDPEDALGPSDFVLIGSETTQELFRLGNNNKAGRYYLSYRFGEHSGLWWGHTMLAGAPGVDALPLDPLQLLAVLNVNELPSPLAQQPPAVGLTMNLNPCAYVLTYMDKQPVTGRLMFRREVLYRWSDTEPARAFRINFFDPLGRRVMTAELDDYKPIDIEGVNPAPATKPVMPTEISITWFDPERYQPLSTEFRQRGTLKLSLSEMKLNVKGSPLATEPPESSSFPADRVVQVDKDVNLGVIK